MSRFRRLPGLPPYGPMAISFPPELGPTGREGLVVEFEMENGDVWVGNFRGRMGGLNDVRAHPDGRRVLVASDGALWLVSPQMGTAQESPFAFFGVWQVATTLVYSIQDIEFVCLDEAGMAWRTRRISWDGFQHLGFDKDRLTGEAWSPIENCWLPFSVDLRNGTVDGGSYTGPAQTIRDCF